MEEVAVKARENGKGTETLHKRAGSKKKTLFLKIKRINAVKYFEKSTS
jgi:hypothetical protein